MRWRVVELHGARVIRGSITGDKTDMYGPFGGHVQGEFLYVGRVWQWRCNSVVGEIINPVVLA